MSSSEQSYSLLNVIRIADNFPSFSTPYPRQHPITKKNLIPFYLTLSDFKNSLPPIGLIPSHNHDLIKRFKDEQGLQLFTIIKKISKEEKARNEKKKSKSSSKEQDEKAKDDEKAKPAEGSSADVKGKEKEKRKKREKKTIKTEVMNRLTEKMKDEGKFSKGLRAWTSEKIPVFASSHSSCWKNDKDAVNIPFGNIAFEIERAAAPIFCLTALSMHLTAYEGEGEDMKIWLPKYADSEKDSKSKLFSVSEKLEFAFHLIHQSSERNQLLFAESFFLMMKTVECEFTGTGVTPIDSLSKCGHQDLGWSEECIKRNAKSTGIVSLFQVANYTYDLKLPSQDSPDYLAPKASHEGVSYKLYTVPEVLEALKSNQFWSNSAIATIDFLIKHGIITPENEPNYAEIVKRLHRSTGIAGPGN
ncbi:uncharacterized protein L201_000421 [Kwoniella dendrophila CBS 6074]|uniref:Uncharacterized protein n=1 Tax=Kwoniella dendrophila CBS 6074 TaxID=1295534 RepID=A0AAX4JL92_9TREE